MPISRAWTATMSKPPSPADRERERRLAEALRANLRKRKAQAREAKADDAPGVFSSQVESPDDSENAVK